MNLFITILHSKYKIETHHPDQTLLQMYTSASITQTKLRLVRETLALNHGNKFDPLTHKRQVEWARWEINGRLM